MRIEIRTRTREEFVDVTREVARALSESGLYSGLLVVYCPHTTAGVTINEHADPDVASDLERAFEKLVPEVRFDHGEGNSPSHFLASVVGPSLVVPIRAGRLQLGTWQGVFFCEFDGPRTRQVWVQTL